MYIGTQTALKFCAKRKERKEFNRRNQMFDQLIESAGNEERKHDCTCLCRIKTALFLHMRADIAKKYTTTNDEAIK